MTQVRVAAAVNQSLSRVSTSLRLLTLPEGVREHIRAGRLSAGHGVALLNYAAFPVALAAIADVVVEHGLTSRQVEAKLGVWGPAGLIGTSLIRQGLGVQMGG